MWPVLIPLIFSFVYGVIAKNNKHFMVWVAINFFICLMSSLLIDYLGESCLRSSVECNFQYNTFDQYHTFDLNILRQSFIMLAISLPIMAWGVKVGNSIKKIDYEK